MLVAETVRDGWATTYSLLKWYVFSLPELLRTLTKPAYFSSPAEGVGKLKFIRPFRLEISVASSFVGRYDNFCFIRVAGKQVIGFW
jgi:hypothetical protein